MHGGLTASYEKLILDAEMLAMMQAYFTPLEVSDDSLGLSAIAEAGVGGISLAPPIPWRATRPPFTRRCCPMATITRHGCSADRKEAPQRANRIWKDLLARYEPPPMDAGHRAAVEDYIARRKFEGGVDTN